jgi:uncharacterized membrane protein YbhN (UPF0104 family)
VNEPLDQLEDPGRGPAAGAPAGKPSRSPRSLAFKIALRVGLIVALLVLLWRLLDAVLDDFDPEAVWEAVRGYGDAEIISMLAVFLIWVAANGWLVAAVADIDIGKGTLAWLGPSSVAAVVPGPSDLAVRYEMYSSWGLGSRSSALAVATSGVFTVGTKLVLPPIALVTLLAVGDSEGLVTRIGVLAAVVLVAAGLVGFAVLRSHRVALWLGGIVERVWSFVLRLARRPDHDGLVDRVLGLRGEMSAILGERWYGATAASALTAATGTALLTLAVRFAGVPEDVVGFHHIFVTYAVVHGLTVIPLTPGNAGIAEVASIALLVAFAGQEWANQITAAVLVYRVLTWLALIPIGWIALTIWRRGHRAAAVT